MNAGYSGTPLAKKLGLKADTMLLTIGAPTQFQQWLGELPDGVVVKARGNRAVTHTADLVHLFVTDQATLITELATLRTQMRSDAAVWVSWPKKSSKVPTDITEDIIRTVALPMGWVDIKVCAVTEVWSGLKLVVRKELRA